MIKGAATKFYGTRDILLGVAPRLSLIRSLIHPRTSASIGVHRGSLSRQRDDRGQP